MDSNNEARASEDELTQLSSPSFDSAATDRAHPVVPLGNVSESTSSPHRGIGMFPAIRRVRPAILAVVAVLVAAAIVGAATALYIRQQSTSVPTSTQVSDPIAPERSLAAEESTARKDTTPLAPSKRRANPDLDTAQIPSRRMDYPTPKEEVLATIREVLGERIRSRGKHQGKRKHGKNEEADDDN